MAEGERELKFTVPAGRVAFARRWLEMVCRRDPRFPAADVWTIYYDTPQLESLVEKINSTHLKLKLRVRWYAAVDGVPSGPAFIEAKTREGTRRAKHRVQAPFTAEELAQWDLSDRRLAALPDLLRGEGVLLRGPWQPLLQLKYRRDRFVDPPSGTRISLDADIVLTGVNRRLLPEGDRSPLGVGVLEVKGSAEQLPASLRGLLRTGIRQQSFSKFLAVYRHFARLAS